MTATAASVGSSVGSSIGAPSLASALGEFHRSPAYAGLAETLTVLIGDGRIPLGTQLPSERALGDALGLSRTTITRAYAALAETGYASARRGAGTFTTVPGGRRRAHDRALLPHTGDDVAIDLNCAAASAPPGLAEAYAAAGAELPAYLGGHGYFPAGLPALQSAIADTYRARGLPTGPDQIMVTPGALSAAAVVVQARTHPGDRIMVETPVYPNAVDAIRHAGARLVPAPVDADHGWDLDAIARTLRRTTPRLAYLIPDFQNPTGFVMDADQRAAYAAALRATGTDPIVDEAHQALLLDPGTMPAPFATFAPTTITIGSASKSFWGGLRLGWLRVPEGELERYTRARVRLDLGAPVLEQLVLTRLLTQPEAVLTAHRERLRAQRNALIAAVSSRLPEWHFHRPAGGLSLWCRLPRPVATAVVAEAERLGVLLSPGPTFAAEGGLDRWVRIPWTQPVAVLEDAVDRLAQAWERVGGRAAGTTAERGRVLVA